MFKSKIITILLLAFLVAPVLPVKAQTDTAFITDQTVLQEQYRSLLRQLIDLLLQQVASLQAQLAALQAEQQQQTASAVIAEQNKVKAEADIATARQLKEDRLKELNRVWLEITPYQQENCRKDWWSFKRDLILSVFRSADIDTPEGLKMAEEAGLLDQKSAPADLNDSHYAECLTPGSGQYKTKEQLLINDERLQLIKEIYQ